ncbi:hypothetical protein CsSME_00002615 [Camellia sinensis var. sinensis]
MLMENFLRSKEYWTLVATGWSSFVRSTAEETR